MQPSTAGRAVGGGTGEFDSWRALQRATDEKRAAILADVVGHPKGLPSVEELDYMNPPLSEDAIRRHLNTLREVGVVTRREIEQGDRVQGFPYQFYEVTDEARGLFDRNGLFPEDAWQREYASVQKTDRIRKVEQMPRPGP